MYTCDMGRADQADDKMAAIQFVVHKLNGRKFSSLLSEVCLLKSNVCIEKVQV